MTNEAIYTLEEELEILREARRLAGRTFPFKDLEDLTCSPNGGALGWDESRQFSTVTDLQRACMRIIDGLPLGDLLNRPTVQRALGCTKLPEFTVPPPEVDILAGVRTAKSFIAAMKGLLASQKCDLRGLLDGEIPRYSIVSLEKDNAAVTYGHLAAVLRKPDLMHLRIPRDRSNKWVEIIEDSGLTFSQSLFVWHPSGRPVEIRITAGKRAGAGLVSRWSIGLVLDEAPRMLGEEEAVVNYDDARRAVRTRLRPGAQILSIGSPYRAQGPMYERFLAYWGKPTARRVVVKTTGPAMNPTWWTIERCREIKEEDPDAYKTDVKAEFLEPVSALCHPLEVNRNMRSFPDHYGYEEGHDYVARMDPATRQNAWTFAIADRVGNKKRIVFNQEWRGTSIEPLNTGNVLRDIAHRLREYHCTYVTTDQWSSDALISQAGELLDYDGKNIAFDIIREDWPQDERKKHYKNFADALANDDIELPPDQIFANDIRMIQKVTTADSFTIRLPKTGDGRHCDYAPTAVGLLKDWIDEDMELPPREDEDGYEAYQERMEEERELEEFERQQLGEEGLYLWDEEYFYG